MIYISLGAGVESSALLAMSSFAAHGVPKSEMAIFADTQDEPDWVYRQLAALDKLSPIPIVRVTAGKLSDDPIIRVPAFVPNDRGGVGPLTQNCTRDYKTSVIRREAHRIIRQRGQKTATCLIGISVGEADRQKASGLQWLEHQHPLVDAALTKSACARYLRSVGWPVPRKSACVFCPWRSDRGWRELKEHDPDGFERAAIYDDFVFRERKGHVHKSMIPLREIDFSNDQIEMFSNECEGVCGV